MGTKCKWLKLFLAASLALNLAITAPFLYHKFLKKHGPLPGHMDLSTDHNLNTEQKEKIDAIIKQFKLTLMQYKQDILEKRIDIIDELGDPEFDPARITARTNELNKLHAKLNLFFVETLMQVNAQLEPQQRLNFLYKLSRNWFFLNGKHNPDERGGKHE
jgi:Spy/CpxP family protein refolding chaperone